MARQKIKISSDSILNWNILYIISILSSNFKVMNTVAFILIVRKKLLKKEINQIE